MFQASVIDSSRGLDRSASIHSYFNSRNPYLGPAIDASRNRLQLHVKSGLNRLQLHVKSGLNRLQLQ